MITYNHSLRRLASELRVYDHKNGSVADIDIVANLKVSNTTSLILGSSGGTADMGTVSTSMSSACEYGLFLCYKRHSLHPAPILPIFPSGSTRPWLRNARPTIIMSFRQDVSLIFTVCLQSYMLLDFHGPASIPGAASVAPRNISGACSPQSIVEEKVDHFPAHSACITTCTSTCAYVCTYLRS